MCEAVIEAALLIMTHGTMVYVILYAFVFDLGCLISADFRTR